MNDKKFNFTAVILCIFEALIGILLLINPAAFSSAVIITAGIGLTVWGIISIIGYFAADPVQAAMSRLLVTGLGAVAAGLFCVFKYRTLIITFPVITVIFGLGVLITGLYKTQTTIDMLRLRLKGWYISAIGAAVSIICSVVILKNPFASTTALWMFLGISLIVAAVLDIIAIIARMLCRK